MHLAGKQCATMDQAAIHCKAFLTWVHGVERLPLRFRLAFDMKRNRDVVETEPVPSEDLAKLMDALAVIPKNPLEWLRKQALGGTMWETGFRVSEAISLIIVSYRFDDKGGV